MASIKDAYCLQMDKIVTSSQARVAFLSSENTYDKFSFYCVHCGIRLSGANVHKREELTSRNKTSHFKIYTKGTTHTGSKCLNLNTTKTTSKGGGSTTVSGDLIVYTKFKLSQIDYEIKTGITSIPPSSLPTSITEKASESTIECDIHTTSILKDLVYCFNELSALHQLENYPLHVEGDALEENTYEKVFRKFKDTNKREKNRRKLNEYNDNFFKYRVLYGAIKNKTIKKETNGWSVLIDFEGQFFARRYINDEEKLKPMFVRVFIPNSTLSAYSHLKNKYLEDECKKDTKGNYIYDNDGEKIMLELDQCYIINCKPEIEDIPNNSGIGTHEELVFTVNNLNHLHFTFKE